MAKKSSEIEVRKAVLKWSKSQFKEQIETQIARGEELLNFEIPSRMVSSGYGITVQKVYDEDKFEEFKIAKTQWETVTKEILRQAFDIPNNEYHAQFYNAGQIVAFYGHTDWPLEYKKEVKKKIASLQSLLLQLQFIQSEQQEQNVRPNQVKPKKIFISHSSKDAEFAKALVNLLITMGFNDKEIFCSSVPGFWVEDGEDFFEVIKKHFVEFELYVIFIHSPRFYDSHISLNEMGAAWVLHSEFSSFLTVDMSFGQMDAVVPNTKVAVKVNGDEVEGRMNDWKRRILDWFGKQPINDNLWEFIRKDFLEKVCRIEIQGETKSPAEKVKKPAISLTRKDEERLKIWVDSEDNSMYQVWYEGGSAVFGLGPKNQYEVKAGREMAEWQGFFKRLLANGLVEETGKYQGHPTYQLTENAYTYFENNNE